MNELQVQIASQAYAGLDRICSQLQAAMKKCPELAEVLRRTSMGEAPQLIGLDFETLDNKISVRPVISRRLREIADAATRLAEWEPGPESDLQKSGALRLMIDLTAPIEAGGAAARMARAISAAQRYC
ncbi:hypothetical protein PcP3B5_46500 [Pseudomonas citronellolis]|nr:hypothetical protein PcP3B5_46500 [Pseudomonas citronellolis]